jgi:hypothetical protein
MHAMYFCWFALPAADMVMAARDAYPPKEGNE